MTRAQKQPARSQPPRRVLLVSPTFPPAPGGIERVVGALAEHLADLGVQVVAGTWTDSHSTGMDTPPGLHVHRVWNRPSGGRKATIALNVSAARIGRQIRPSVVIAAHIRAVPSARLLSRRLGSRTLLLVHAKEMGEQPGLARAAVAWADAIAAASSFSSQLAREAGADPRQVRIINPGLTFPVDEPPRTIDRQGAPTVLTVSRMDDLHKGHLQALAAVPLLRERIPNLRWIMVGEGRLRQSLMDTAAAQGLDGTMEFPGAVTDQELRRLFEIAHVFCLASQRPVEGNAGEGFGMVLTEAASFALPVVAGRVPGVIDAVRDGETGLLVEAEDPDALAGALERLLVDRSLATDLGLAGRARARELDWPLVADRYREAIATMTRHPPSSTAAPDRQWLVDLLRGPNPR